MYRYCIKLVQSLISLENTETLTSTSITTTGYSTTGDGTTTAGNVQEPGRTTKSNAGAIAGGVIGGIAGAGALAALVFFFLYKRRKDRKSSEEQRDFRLEKMSSSREKSKSCESVSYKYKLK